MTLDDICEHETPFSDPLSTFPPILAMPVDFTFAPAIGFMPGAPTTATYIVNSDGVALEGSETFELEIVVTDTIINLASMTIPVIIQPKVTVTIIDKDGRYFSCTAVR